MDSRERVATWWSVAAGGTVLAVTWALALPASVSGAELWWFRLINDLPDWLDGPSWLIMQFGSLAMVPVVAAAVYLAWRRWQGAIVVLGAGFAAWLAARLVKVIVGRGRPPDLLETLHLRSEWTGAGYVSGHSAVAFAVAAVVAPSLGRTGKALVWAAAAATGLFRIYTGAHLPLDVVGGAALGVVLGTVARQLAMPNAAPEREESA